MISNTFQSVSGMDTSRKCSLPTVMSQMLVLIKVLINNMPVVGAGPKARHTQKQTLTRGSPLCEYLDVCSKKYNSFSNQQRAKSVCWLSPKMAASAPPHKFFVLFKLRACFIMLTVTDHDTNIKFSVFC